MLYQLSYSGFYTKSRRFGREADYCVGPTSACLFWSRRPESNRRPTPYHGVALPTELLRLLYYSPDASVGRPTTASAILRHIQREQRQRTVSGTIFQSLLRQHFYFRTKEVAVVFIKRIVACVPLARKLERLCVSILDGRELEVTLLHRCIKYGTFAFSVSLA